MTTPTPPLNAQDRATFALGMPLCALFLDLTINENGYHPLTLVFLTMAGIACYAAIIFRPGRRVEEFLRKRAAVLLAAIIVTPLIFVLTQHMKDPAIWLPVLVLAALGFLQIGDLGAMRIPLLLILVIGYCAVYALTFVSPQRAKDPKIDVFTFHQTAAEALKNGQNPYATRIPNMYGDSTSAKFQNPPRFGPGTGAYGPGVVDNNGWLTYGFPYPPLSLVMMMPAYLLSGDCRFACLVATGLTAVLMALARPGRWGALMALLLLVNPKAFDVMDASWTEPLLLFFFSLVMFCACRWRRGLPWALGFFLATKQYTVLLLPVLFLLVEGPNPFRQIVKMLAKASLVIAVVTLPFFAWNPHEFIRDVVQFQFVQPFRADSLSFMVWIRNHNGGHLPPMWMPFLITIPAIVIAIYRCERSPSGFAAAVTIICYTFFAFNKQAFCNYYYFVIGAALWSVAAMWPQSGSPSPTFQETDGEQGLLPNLCSE